jgi:hypothetical protein
MVEPVLIVGGGPRAGQAFAHQVARTRSARAVAFALGALILTTSSLTLPAAANAQSAACCDGVRPQDEIVLVNVRPVCGTCDSDALATGVQLQSYQVCDSSGRRQWQPYDLQSLLGADPSMPTVIFVHGNQIASGQDKQEGLSVYRRLVNCGGNDGPIRYVIFSWPSTKIHGPLKDVRVKAARTRPAACELAWLLNQMPAETPITLIGYSYGARIITGGLHVLAGGTLGGLGLDQPLQPGRRPVNAVLVAAALNAEWLGPGRYNGLAMSQMGHLLLLNNCQDLAMRYYHFSTTCGRPQALGLRGPTCIAPEDAAKITKRDLSRYDGPRHDLFRYLAAPGVICQIWQLVAETETVSPTLN